ncbi:hypothetical protein PGB90_004121 [Kerria lacca]
MNKAMFRKIILLFSFLIIKTCHGQCSKEEYKKCVILADPLLKDSLLIYPDNLKDIDRVCRTWSQFVDCIKRYTDLCFTENKRKEFNKAVESPVDLVHQMCTSTDYQNDYLKHAPCMRATLTDDSHCGRHYRHLVSQVFGEPATPALCCSLFRFRECLLDQTQRSCNKDAYPFAKQILDKAMGFLQDQCSSYKPDQIDCPGTDFYTGSGNRMTQSWTDLNTARISPDMNVWPDERRTTMRKYDWITNSWTAPSPDSQSENSENSRTGYSRGLNWDPSTDLVSWKISGGLQTEASWNPTVKVTTTGNMLIDEPNQQGLSNENSGSRSKYSQTFYCTIFLVLFYFNYRH